MTKMITKMSLKPTPRFAVRQPYLVAFYDKEGEEETY
jgi:hypothetical protein